jgi:hypothetical protein
MCTSLVGRGHLEPWPLSGFATQRVWVSEPAGFKYPLPFFDLDSFYENYNIPSFALPRTRISPSFPSALGSTRRKRKHALL